MLVFYLFVDFVSVVFFFKQKTAYEMRISDWSSDVCSSDLPLAVGQRLVTTDGVMRRWDGFVTRGDGATAVMSSRATSGRVTPSTAMPIGEIGRASCRESVCQYV